MRWQLYLRVIGFSCIIVDIKHDNRLFVKYFFSQHKDIFENYLGMVMVSTIWLSVSRFSEMAGIPED